jgi:phenylacetyl-CoA:acceptor oxidoreductase subunit 2
MNGVDPWRQTYWDWRAAGNFVAGGTGSGLLLITAVAGLQGGPVVWLTLLSLILVAAGLALVWLELGRPWRFLHVFFNPHTSWMTREAIVAMPLLVLGVAGALTNRLELVWAAALVSMGFLYCQGRILIAAKGIPVWRTPRIMGLIVTTGIVEGCGVYLLFSPWLAPGAIARTFPLVMALLLVALVGRFYAWWVYRNGLKGKAPKAALAVLNRSNLPFITIGHLLPALAIMAGLLFPGARLLFALLAGASAAGAGWYIKSVIITRAAFNQGYAIEHSPARGGGKPGPGVKPGWE